LGDASTSHGDLVPTPATLWDVAFAFGLNDGLPRWSGVNYARIKYQFADSAALDLGHYWHRTVRSLDSDAEQVALSIVPKWGRA